MPEIVHEFPVRAPAARVFEAVSTPEGLDAWWTLHSSGVPRPGAAWTLDFGPGYRWTAIVTRCDASAAFALDLTDAMPDWMGTRVQFELTDDGSGSAIVRFSHAGWTDATQHFRVSSYCWAMYLRLLRRYVERGERIPYAERLDA